MTSLIINMPHLQSRRQRHGEMLLSLLCWAWFLMPLVIVGGWLMGFRVLAQEVVWLGGWQSLLGLVDVAATMIILLTSLWLFWTFLELFGRRPRLGPIAPTVDMAVAMGADPAGVSAALNARCVTVSFTSAGQVREITAGIPVAGNHGFLRAA